MSTSEPISSPQDSSLSSPFSSLSSSLSPLANILADSLRKNIEERRQKILAFLDAEDFDAVMETCRLLENQNPDPGTLQFVQHIKDSVRFSLKKRIEKKLTENEKQNMPDLPDLQTEIANFTRFFPKDDMIETYQTQLAAFLRRDAQKEKHLLEKELDNIRSIENPGKALAGLITFNRQHPDFAREAFVPRQIQDLKKILLYEHLRSLQDRIQDDQLEAAGKALAEIKSEDLKEFPLLDQEYKNISALYARRKNDRDRRKTDAYLETLEKALEEEDIGALQPLLSQKESFPFTDADKIRFQNIQRLAQIRTALLAYQQIVNRPPLEDLASLTEEDARTILSSFPGLLDDLPPDLSLKFRDKLLFHACASYMKMGEPDKARKIFQDLLKEFPHSPYLSLAARMVSD